MQLVDILGGLFEVLPVVSQHPLPAEEFLRKLLDSAPLEDYIAGGIVLLILAFFGELAERLIWGG